MKIGPKIVQTKTLQFQPKNSGNIKVGAQKRNVYVEPKSKKQGKCFNIYILKTKKL